MSVEEPIDIVLTIAVVSFDGRVLELFGRSDAERIHIATITGIDYDGGDFVIHTSNQTEHPIVINESDEPKRGDVESLIDRVRSAAPSPEGSA